MKKIVKLLSLILCSALLVFACGSNREKEYGSQTNNHEKFVGKYYFDDGNGIEVLPDGRVIQISNHSYLGQIYIHNDNLFESNVGLLHNLQEYTVFNKKVSESRRLPMNGELLFDLTENRAYYFLEEYNNRDIAAARFVKFSRRK